MIDIFFTCLFTCLLLVNRLIKLTIKIYNYKMRKIMVYKFLGFLFISHEMRRHEGFRSADNSYYVITNIR
jgi:hypothetical protein